MKTKQYILVGALVASLLPIVHAQSASPEDRLRGALRDTTRQLHEAQDELAALRAEVTSLRQQAAAAPQACPPTPEFSPRARQHISALSAENASLRQYAAEAQKTIAKWQEVQDQWQANLQQSSQQAQLNEAAARTLEEKLKQTEQLAQQASARDKDCTAKNAQLVEISSALLARYRDKGIWDVFLNAEPMTQIHRVRFETLLQEYGGKIQDSEVHSSDQVAEHGNTK